MCVLWLHAGLTWLWGTPFMANYTLKPHPRFLSRAACSPTVAACTLGLALCMPRMATHSVPASVFTGPCCMCASCGCMHARLGFVCAMGGYTFISSIVFFCARLQGRQLWLQAGLAWLGFVYALYGYTFSASTCIFLSRAACTLGLAFRAPCMGSHSIPPSAASEPSCTCADCGCMHACLGSVYALHGYTPSSSICIFCAVLHVRQLWLHARLVWLCVCPAWLCTQFHHLYFLSRPACAPAAGMHAWPGFVYAL
jgi:hypothetical protein